jgi:serine/threonine protein kinase
LDWQGSSGLTANKSVATVYLASGQLTADHRFFCNLLPIKSWYLVRGEIMDKKEIEKTCQHCKKPLDAKAIQGLCPACLLKAGWPTATEGDGTSGQGFTPPEIEQLAGLFPQLEILELIGQGGMGAVYKARQAELDRFVALKVLAPRDKADPGFAERFTREARALARLSHPNIVAVYDFGHRDELPYFIMEYVDGPNLRQVQKAGELETRTALKIIPQICEALQFAHDEGVVHRDIKPENVLLSKKGRIKIADFGLAKIMGKAHETLTLTQAGHVMGTPHYMAPEQVEHPQEVDHRADIYSLGVVFYEMLTGELPLGRFAPPSQKVEVDVRLDEVVLRTLEKEPKLRYQQASQVGTEVQTIVRTPGIRAAGDAVKTSSCYVSTPEYLQSFRGRFLKIDQGKGELRLDSEALSFQSGWQMVTIPLASIRKLAQGDYPATAKPLTLNYMAVTFAQHGDSRTLLFTPFEREGVSVQRTNAVVQAWLSALQEAVRNSTGHGVSVEPVELAQDSFWGAAIKTFVVTAVLAVPGFALIPILCYHRLPNRWYEFMPAVFVAAFVTGVLFILRWWQSRHAWKQAAQPLPLEQRLKVRAAHIVGVNFRSQRTLWGIPLVHVATGPDPVTGGRGVAKGIIAIGDIAIGGLAFGAVAIGGISFGGASIGGLAFGGAALGLLALGGLAIALITALGGGAIGTIAVGGGAVGYYAFGGVAFGVHTVSGQVKEPVAQAFFESWTPLLVESFWWWSIPLLLVTIGVGTAVPMIVRARLNKDATTDFQWRRMFLLELILGLALLGAFFVYDRLPDKDRVKARPQSVEALAGFTPMCEIPLQAGVTLENCFLDLDTGRVLSAPQALAESLGGGGHPQINHELARWMQNNGVDLFRRTNDLTLIDGFSIQVGGRRERPFETITAEEMAQDGAYVSEFLDEELPVDPNAPVRTMFALRQEGGIYKILTRSGRPGLIQILEDNVETGELRIRYKLVSGVVIQTPNTDGPTASSTADANQLTIPFSNRGQIRLPNGVEFEVAGVLPDPCNSTSWYTHDGNALVQPLEEIKMFPQLLDHGVDVNLVKAQNEFLICVRHHTEGAEIDGGGWISQVQFEPQPDVYSIPTRIDYRMDRQREAKWICYSNPPEAVDMHIQAATGPWEPITEFDSQMEKIRDIVPSGTVQGEPIRSSEGRIVRFKLMHKLDRKTYALRLAAILQDGQIIDTPFYDENVSDGFIKSVAVIHTWRIKPEEVEKYVLERSPWVRGVIRNIRLVAQ